MSGSFLFSSHSLSVSKCIFLCFDGTLSMCYGYLYCFILLYCYTYTVIPRMFKGFLKMFKGFARVFHGNFVLFNSDSSIFFYLVFQHFSRMFWISNVWQIFQGVSRVYQSVFRLCFKGISWLFNWCVKVILLCFSMGGGLKRMSFSFVFILYLRL